MGLPVFLMLTCALGVRRPTLPPAHPFISKRVKRLLLPWLAWFGIYAAFSIARATLGQHTEPAFAWFDPYMLLFGPTIELWFLPYAFAAGIATYSVVRFTSGFRSSFVIMGAMMVGIAALMAVEFYDWSFFPSPFPQWVFGAASVPFGVALGRVIRVVTRTASPPWKQLVIAASACLLVWLIGMTLPGEDLYTISRFFLAIGLILAVLAFPGKRDRITDAILPMLFGIYLVHAMVIDVGRHQLAEMPRLAAVAAVFAVSVAAVMVMRKTPMKAVV